MTERLEIYKCETCGNIVEVLIDGQGELVCCGQPMTLLQEKTQDPSFGEKHVPVAESFGGVTEVKIGSQPHPMTEEHYIMFIETISNKGRSLKYLHPLEQPIVRFDTDNDFEFVREYCNIHGLWRN